jgi:hypothetical protein
MRQETFAMRLIYAVIFNSAFALSVGAPLQGAAQTTLQITKSPLEMRGLDTSSGIEFNAVLATRDLVIIDTYLGTKQVHAEIDYGRRHLVIRSISRADGKIAKLTADDITAFQKLLIVLPPVANAETRLGDALTSLVNLVGVAPGENEIDLQIQSAAHTYTSICGSIGQTEIASYKLSRKDGGPQNIPVTVGPICYVPPALGRCGAGGGPDPGIGLVQRFTQQCLNHDQCCAATRDRFRGPANICGNSGSECVPEFTKAAPGFFFAPDCGTTAGTWTDSYSAQYTLTGGDSSGSDNSFSGTVNTNTCGTWNVQGTRTGTNIVFTATNPAPGGSCGQSYTYTGVYTDCNAANGTWTNSPAGFSGAWSWSRTNTVSIHQVFLSLSSRKPTDNK